MARFDHITFIHLQQAMERMQKEGVPKARATNKYEAQYNGWAYPHRYLISLAGFFAGEFIRYKDIETNKSITQFLSKYEIDLISKEDALKLKRPNQKEESFHHKYLEQRVARICFNTNGWRGPSGSDGKSDFKQLFECQFRFGFDEWLFDDSKEIDGYHYALIQPVYKGWKSYIGDMFNVRLYTIDGRTKQRYWAGLLEGVEVISKEESKRVYRIYQKNSWIRERIKELKQAGANTKDWLEQYEWEFTVKIPINQIRNRDVTLVRFEGDEGIKGDRYNLRREIKSREYTPASAFQFASGQFDKRGSIKRRFVEKETEHQNRHLKIQEALIEKLVKEFGTENVAYEILLNFGNKADVMVRRGTDLYDIYEVKSYASLMTSIRVALGQLMEYALTNSFNTNKLVLVSDIMPTEEIKAHIKTLNDQLGFDFSYKQISLVSQNRKED